MTARITVTPPVYAALSQPCHVAALADFDVNPFDAAMVYELLRAERGTVEDAWQAMIATYFESEAPPVVDVVKPVMAKQRPAPVAAVLNVVTEWLK